MSLNTDTTDAFIAAGARIARHGLLACSCGNLSWRCEASDQALVSASGSWLGQLQKDEIALCSLPDMASLNGVRPSVESAFHGGILAARSDIQVVLHHQSPHATAIACLKELPTDFAIIPEVPFYIGTPAVVPYHTPGSPELAQAVIDAVTGGANVVLLRNHGLVIVGQDDDEVFQRAQFFELACRILLLTGDRCAMIPAQGQADLQAMAAAKRSVTQGS